MSLGVSHREAKRALNNRKFSLSEICRTYTERMFEWHCNSILTRWLTRKRQPPPSLALVFPLHLPVLSRSAWEVRQHWVRHILETSLQGSLIVFSSNIWQECTIHPEDNLANEPQLSVIQHSCSNASKHRWSQKEPSKKKHAGAKSRFKLSISLGICLLTLRMPMFLLPHALRHIASGSIILRSEQRSLEPSHTQPP